MNKTLNLKASKALATLGIEVESEKHHVYVSDGSGMYWDIRVLDKSYNLNKNYPALNLQELLSALPDVGKVMGWSEICNWCGGREYKDTQIMPGDMKGVICTQKCGWWSDVKKDESTYHTHKITDKFTVGGMDAVSKYILELLDKK